MARRRRKSATQSVLSEFDWSIHPDTLREVLSVVCVFGGIFGLLALFDAGGSFGSTLNGWLNGLLGLVRFLIPVLTIGIGVMLWNPSRFHLRWTAILGIGLLLLTLPGFIAPYGGSIGQSVSAMATNAFGSLGGMLVLLGFVATSLLLVINTSLRGVLGQLSQLVGSDPQIRENQETSTGEARVPLFEALQQKLRGSGGSNAAVPVAEANLRPAPSLIPTGDWEFPPLDLLAYPTGKATPGNVAKNVELIEKNLKDFGVAVTMGDVNVGPTVSQYTLKPSEGVKLTKITSRTNDLALALAAPSIRIEAPIPGKSAVGIEVPNKVPAMVTLREVLETDQAKAIKSNLTISLGRDAAGAPVAVDLKKMPHLLIAGSTGSGKSIAINAIITGMLYQNTPSQLRMILVDPKRVEFTPYNDIPHLLTPVVTEPDKTVNTLKWSLIEMERRFRMFQEVGSRDIESYNDKHRDAPLPYILIVIDELADLMVQSAKEVEGAIVRLAQMARAVGMHLVVATQRPSVDVITGLIKANITTRIAFAVASQIDSRTIIDSAGAEKLLGHGDMLFLSSANSNRPRRIQGCLITEKEIQSVTDFIKSHSSPQYDDSILNYAPRGLAGGVGGDGEVDDDLYNEAKKLVIETGKASASLLQRRLRVGYARAARLLDLLEDQGVIGPADGAKPRDVLVGFNTDFSSLPHSQSQNPPSSGGSQGPNPPSF